jgi:hypothetical protein
MNQVTVFSPDTHAMTYTDKKGTLHAITAEGAVFKGGAALAQLKSHAVESALTKAVGGRYRAASDVLCAAFPAIGKAAEKLIGTPWANKSSFVTLVNAVFHAEPKEGKGWSAKQTEARMLAHAFIKATTPTEQVAEGEVVGEAV